jgi:hypothetical protein
VILVYRSTIQHKERGKKKMPKITFTKETAMSRIRITPPVWAHVKLVSQDQSVDKNGQTTYPCKFIIVSPEKYEGMPISHWFFENSMGEAFDFIRACMSGEEPELGKQYDLSDCLNKVVKAYAWFNDGRGYNTLKDFQAIEQTASFKA